MPYVTIEDRVDRLEALFGQFLTEMALLNKRAEERHKAAEERHQAAEERHQAAEERHQAAEERRARFEQENREFKVEMRQSKRDLDKKWGDLANKMGTIIEDIVAPNLSRLAREHFRLEPIEDFMIRRSRRQPSHPEVESEFDALVVGPEAVILGEAKSSPSLEYADAFATKVRGFSDFFPEYRGKRLIAVFGSWAIPDPVVERLTAHGIYALRMGADTMELANAGALEARTAPPPR
ncbi:MAG: hypothetical protein HYY24_20570 [Verrucomicrobia bacterium]|nr:hypothetical protein [Verrucomicrobiota bacterium]